MLVIQTPSRPATAPRQSLPLRCPSKAAATDEPDPTANHLLAALTDADWRHWSHQLERVEMPLGQVLYDSGSRLTHVHFPTTAVVSLLVLMANLRRRRR